ncbi:LLM class flavin-dependent oxidoreductase [Halotalea alkalilenta]|uniref:LLM class flavin-dependent oxidoreductase n=1 Tax=Halotalea alkalilenta TaxID=376489 RepID=UPI001B805E87|nr:LLM class flavin-dependent oxidoreductase [Halotalea alkalilenta]
MKEILLNAFDMNCIVHQSPGLWRHPRDRARDYRRLDYWLELARTLERGRFDALFIADVLGVYDVYRGDASEALRGAVQVPVNDPLPLVAAMATVTEHLGFGLTASLSFEHPYPFARRLSTLDHLTDGRVGWNIVTSYLESGARNLGQRQQLDHDQRYDLAEEYLEVCYKLWEGSWEEAAVLREAAANRYADPARVHPIDHRGRYFEVPGIHLCEPSPQRTPVLFQAGASSRGTAFAARHAECVFVAAPSKTVLRKVVEGLRHQAEIAGRAPDALKIFNLHTVIVDDSDALARARHREYLDYVDLDGALTLISGWTGLDMAGFDPRQPLAHVHTNAIQSAVEAFSSADPGRVWTPEEIARWVGIGGYGPLSVGSPESVADELEAWVEETGVDGFNLAYAVTPETFEAVVDLLVPELTRRGRYKSEYRSGSLRQKLFGAGDRLAAPHPGAGYRFQAQRERLEVAR